MADMNLLETMDCDGEIRQHFDRSTDGFLEAVAAIEAQFGKQNAAAWRSISTPQYNSIFDDSVVSVLYVTLPPMYDQQRLIHFGRKYFLNHEWIYDKVYYVARPETCELPYPEGAQLIATGELVNVLGQPGDDDLSRYKCLYFMHPDHAAVESWVGKSLPQGKYSTGYAVTFDTQDNDKVMRVKTYVYDEHTMYSDWDITWHRYTIRADRLAALAAKQAA